MNDSGPDIILQIRPLKSDRPISVRLRWILKQILRQQQFECRMITGGNPETWSEPTVEAAAISFDVTDNPIGGTSPTGKDSK